MKWQKCNETQAFTTADTLPSLCRDLSRSHTLPGLHSCVQQSSWTHTEATVVGSSQFVSTTWCFTGSNNTAFTHQRSNWMAILARSHALCWLEPLACLLSCVSARVTAKLKPLMYYSSTHVRYYRGTGWCGQGAACTAAPRGQEVDTDRPISKLVNRATYSQAGRGRIHNKSFLQMFIQFSCLTLSPNLEAVNITGGHSSQQPLGVVSL